MKHLSLTLLLAAMCSLSVTAKPIQPIIFDDPNFDIHSTDLSAEQRSFFDSYIHAMEQMAKGEDAGKFFIIEEVNMADTTVVAPLLGAINYNQGTPYNNKCPWMNGGRAVTGCVATAMAQVMRYWQYPANGTGTFTYTGGTGGARTVNLEDMPFDWTNMLPTYDGVSYTQQQADAVATLMLACGAALNMNYDVDGSSSNTEKVNKLLRNNFGYNKAAAYSTTLGAANPEEVMYYWGEDAVRPDLEAGRPLIFAGYPAQGQTGHCFVIDGYKVENNMYYYHVNWGWGGHGNSWCLLNYLHYGSDNYSGHGLSMVYNIYPNGSQDIESVEVDESSRAAKILHEGNLYIIRDGKYYSAQGQFVK